MSVSTGEITKITIAPYRGSDKLEASVMMLVGGEEVRRRWKSPHTSRTSTERWAREKARAFLTGRVAREKEPAPMFAEFAVRFVADHVRACRLRPSTAANMQMNLKQHLIPMFGALRVDRDHRRPCPRDQDARPRRRHHQQDPPGARPDLAGRPGEEARGQRAEDQAAQGQQPPPRLLHPEDYERLVHAAGSDPRTLVLVLLGGDAGMRSARSSPSSGAASTTGPTRSTWSSPTGTATSARRRGASPARSR
jgi:hypothetical protein